MMFQETGVKLHRLATIEEEVTFSLVVDGHPVDHVTFATYYEPAVEIFDEYVVLWAGPRLCVVDRHRFTLRCMEREDETHRVHQLNDLWIVEGELRIDLFDPPTLQVLATYTHDEVITDSWLNGELVCIRDFQNRTFCLDTSEKLAPVATDS
jgi:hypothetical protein